MSSGKGGSSSQITGYRYTMSVQFGIGRGPINELSEIRAGDLLAWAGSMTESAYQAINQPNLFGGDQKEGGLVGTFKLMMGEPTQVVDDVIKQNIEGAFPVPGWRGVTTLFYYGQICSNNPYPKAWKFRVSRTTAGWDTPVWEPDLARIDMAATLLTLVSFNAQPHSGDTLFIGEVQIGFFTLVSGPPPTSVQIGSDAAATASAFAAMCNVNTGALYGVTASVVDTQVTLQFPTEVTVRTGRGTFATVSSQGGFIKAMNPAHIIYECATNNVWGRGLPESLLDRDSFKNCALQLMSENFGLCLRWNRQEDIDKFVKTIVDHIGAAVFINRQTGLLTMKLIRDDYNPDDLEPFTFENGILDITEDASSSADTTFNEVIVAFVDPVSGKRGQVRVQNIASFQALGTLISTTVEYLGVPTAALALRLAQRDLQMNSGDIRRLKIKFDRVAWYISPGDVFKISVPSRGIENMILRAGAIDDGPIEDETITITAVQDVFTLPDASFVTPQPSYWTPPDKTPRPVDERLVDELTYYDLAANLAPSQIADLSADMGMIKVFAEQPSGFTVDYVVSSKTSAEADYADRTSAGFDAGARLVSAIGLRDTAITFEDLTQRQLIDTGDIPVLLVDPDDPMVQEYARLNGIDFDTGFATLARGCIDTVLHPFPAGAKLWFQTNMPTSDFRNLSSSETAQVKLITRTSSSALDPSLADVNTVDMGGRQGRPYPPGNLTVNTVAYELSQTLSSSTNIDLAWAHRDRLTQGNFLLEHSAGSTGPEAGTTYTLEVYDGATLVRTVAGITGTSYTYTRGTWTSDGSPDPIRFRLFSVRDGLPSWQAYDFLVYGETGFGEGFDDNFDGGT